MSKVKLRKRSLEERVDWLSFEVATLKILVDKLMNQSSKPSAKEDSSFLEKFEGGRQPLSSELGENSED